MTPDAFLNFFHEHRASAILRTNHADAAAPAMEAAVRSGFRVIEFTLTTPNAFDLIQSFAGRADLAVGAGTVLTEQDARAAVDAGATFLVSPVVDEAVIETAAALNVAIMPGTYTATEMLRAHRLGAPLQKVFPALPNGPKDIKAILGPLPQLNLVPTNGVHENNVAAYFKAGVFAVGFVNNLFDPNDMARGAFDRIEDRGRTMLQAVHKAT